MPRNVGNQALRYVKEKRKNKGDEVKTTTGVERQTGGHGFLKAKRRECFRTEETLSCEPCQKLLSNWIRDVQRKEHQIFQVRGG